MPSSHFRRLQLVLVAVALLAAACTSSTDDNTSSDLSTDDAAQTTDDAAIDDDALATVPALDGPVDPEGVRQLAESLTGGEISGEELTCLVSSADGDSQVTEMFNGAQTESYFFSPEAYTALTVTVHDCLPADTLAESLTLLAGGAGEESDAQFVTCVSDKITAEQTGDLAYTGLSALLVGFEVPEGAQAITIEATTDCVTPDGLANQLGSAREQSSGFTVDADRDCIAAAINDAFIDTFWAGAVSGADTSAALEPLIDGCTSEYDSGLAKELPADFVEFAGEGALADVDPAVRNNVYSEAPPMTIDTSVDYQAVLTTTDGEIVVDLFEDTAPITVNSFIALANDGYYDRTIFHRVLQDFMAQAGDPTGTGTGGPGYSFADEESGLTPIDRRGVLAMANSGPDTNGSQFFITLEATDWLNGLHTVFGEVIEGDDVLGAIDLRDPAAPLGRGDELISVRITEN